MPAVSPGHELWPRAILGAARLALEDDLHIVGLRSQYAASHVAASLMIAHRTCDRILAVSPQQQTPP